MQLLIGGRRVLIGGRVATISENQELVFTVLGTHFPYSNYEPPSSSTGNFNDTRILILSTGSNAVTINYGDGNIIDYDFYGTGSTTRFEMRPSVPLGNGTNQKPIHVYTDSNDGERNISMKFKYPERISNFATTYINLYDVFPTAISGLKNIETITINQSELTQIPDVFSNLDNLRNLTLNSVGTAISERIPQGILGNTSITNLTLAGSVNMADLVASGLYNLCESMLQLEILHINNNNLSSLPVNFDNLVNLSELRVSSVGSSGVNIMFPKIKDLTWLKNLQWYADSNTTSWMDFSALVNLETFQATACPNIPTTIPPGFENLLLLKEYGLYNSYRTQIRMDVFVENMYNFIVANASMTAGNTKFRQMAVRCETSASVGITPSGIYQEPSGYIQGSNNGTPSSPLEMIWVMVNQYEHTWTY